MRRHVTFASAATALLSTLALAACADAPTAPAAAVAPRAVVVAPTPNVGTGSRARQAPGNLNIPTPVHPPNPRAGGRFGEIVVFEGNQHLVFFQTTLANGQLATKLQWNGEGVTGIGQYTGFAYRVTGVTQEHYVTGAPLPYSETMINNYHIIGQGQATDMDLHETVRMTVDVDGNVNVSVSDYNFSCKQDPTF